MKQLRVTVAVDPDAAPAFFDLLAKSSAIAEARLLDWNETRDERTTILYAIEGDPGQFRAGATETPGVESVALSDTREGLTYALVEARPAAIPTFEALHRARAQGSLVVRKPIVYRDGAMTCRVVGESAAIQAGIETAPDAMDVTVHAIETVHGTSDRPSATCSERQREALAVALDLGYYEEPREAIHADVAAELDCAPATASHHLRKAEAAAVRALMAEF